MMLGLLRKTGTKAWSTEGTFARYNGPKPALSVFALSSLTIPGSIGRTVRYAQRRQGWKIPLVGVATSG
jgi:hypothetical protein